MRKIGIILLSVAVLASVSMIAMAAERVGNAPAATVAPANEKAAQATSYRLQIGNKVERGVGNVLFGWSEIPRRVVDITKQSRNPIWGLAAGVYQGTGKAFARTASGVCDVLTCGVKPTERAFIQPDMNTEQSNKPRK